MSDTAVGNHDMHPFHNAATLVQNMALAATDMGIGACHIGGAVGVFNSNAELVKELKVSDGKTP